MVSSTSPPPQSNQTYLTPPLPLSGECEPPPNPYTSCFNKIFVIILIKFLIVFSSFYKMISVPRVLQSRTNVIGVLRN